MKLSSELIEAVDAVASEKHIRKQVIFDAIMNGIKHVFERRYGTSDNIRITIQEQLGEVKIEKGLLVVDKITDPETEITPDLIEKKPRTAGQQEGKTYWEVVNSKELNRLAIKSAGLFIKKAMSEAEHNNIFREYSSQEGKIKQGRVVQSEPNYLMVQFQKTFAYIPRGKLIRDEDFRPGELIKFLTEKIIDTDQDVQIKGTRSGEAFLKGIMEQEIPEVFDESVQIVRIARNTGYRSKVAVATNLHSLDPVMACIGPRGQRINNISEELNYEKIDVCLYGEDLKEFVIRAFNPVKTIMIVVEKQVHATPSEVVSDHAGGEAPVVDFYTAHVIVPDEQYPAAIGYKGHNSRLISHITKCHINVIAYSQALSAGINIVWNGNLTAQQLEELKERFRQRNYNFDNLSDDLSKAELLKTFLATHPQVKEAVTTQH